MFPSSNLAVYAVVLQDPYAPASTTSTESDPFGYTNRSWSPITKRILPAQEL